MRTHQRYTRDPLKYLSMPVTSLLVDPLDWHNTYVAPTTLGPDIGEGLFAKRDLPKGALIVSYGGTLITSHNSNNFCNTVRKEKRLQQQQ